MLLLAAPLPGRPQPALAESSDESNSDESVDDEVGGAAAATTPIPNIWNTPNVFGVRALQLVLEDTKAKGGVVAMRERARRRAGAVYDVVDASDGFYVNRVEPKFRSLMTIPITIADKALEEKFVRESSEAGFYNLVGHPLFGGLRVTMYNQLPDDAVDALVEFMTDFYRENAPGGNAPPPPRRGRSRSRAGSLHRSPWTRTVTPRRPCSGCAT